MSDQPHLDDPVPQPPLPESNDSFEADPFDPSVVRLERYVAATTLEPRPDLVSEVSARITREPESTPPRRFISAVGVADRRIGHEGVPSDVGSRARCREDTPMIRAQAAVLVLVVFVVSGFSGAAAFAGAGAGLDLVTTVAREAFSMAPGGRGSSKPEAAEHGEGGDWSVVAKPVREAKKAKPDMDKPVKLAKPDMDKPVKLAKPDMDKPVKKARSDMDKPVKKAKPDMDKSDKPDKPDKKDKSDRKAEKKAKKAKKAKKDKKAKKAEKKDKKAKSDKKKAKKAKKAKKDS